MILDLRAMLFLAVVRRLAGVEFHVYENVAVHYVVPTSRFLKWSEPYTTPLNVSNGGTEMLLVRRCRGIMMNVVSINLDLILY